MKHYFKKITTLAPTVLLAATLASCGGGGGSTTGSSLTYQGIVTNIPTPPLTYTAEEVNVLNQLTLIRPGAGYLTPNTALDTAASNHVTYLISNSLLDASTFPGYLTTTYNGTLGGHYESTVLPNSSNSTGFYGATPQARATTAGYVGTVAEVITFGATDGANCVDLLGDSVYHVIGLISPFIDLGISFDAGGGGNSSACAIEIGVASNTLGQLPATAPVVYPYNGQTGVLPKFYNHAEDPVPANDLPFAGHPVVVSLYTLASPTLSGSDIVINTFSITPNPGTALAVRVLAKTGVTSMPITGPALTVDNVIPGAGFVVLLPTTGPLDPNQLYDVSFSATVKGQAVSKTWSFTTGPAN